MTSTSVFSDVRQQIKSKEKENKNAQIKAHKVRLKAKGNKLLGKIILATVHLSS